eukprot:TRINITY_DN213_c4_g1_i1.p1 TRINITY_DN213_c4_g1~~TRINITY_DN213_c4_g1_i1.p1  ORF type:complete len:177 (+),score=24.98 TRINITY_DN213_c4_g1_i1:72-602(+)
MFADQGVQGMTYMAHPTPAPYAVPGGAPMVDMGQGMGQGMGQVMGQGDGLPPGPPQVAQGPRPSTASGIKVCSNCGGRGHISRNCPSQKECDCCGSIKHQKVECPHKSKVCNVCGKPGHMALKCAKKEEFFDRMLGNSGGGFGGKGKGKGKSDGQCWDFQRGNCTRGANCKWSHSM